MDCFMADVKHGLALFPGTEEEVLETIDRLKRTCKGPTEGLTVAKLGDNISEDEAQYMKSTCLLPRRVRMRLSK